MPVKYYKHQDVHSGKSHVISLQCAHGHCKWECVFFIYLKFKITFSQEQLNDTGNETMEEDNELKLLPGSMNTFYLEGIQP